ncbi:MAG: TIM barrel protein [Anaerolineales bacterium]|nr:TIM barrel protein [Anaerolineales bacterium]
MLKFVLNLGMFFKNVPLLERFKLAKDAGFDVVETLSLVGEDPDQVKNALESAGVRLLQFNLATGDLSTGERGYLCNPDRQDYFRTDVEKSLALARLLGVRQLNCLAGNLENGYIRNEQLACAEQNLKWLHPLLEENDLILNIEQLSSLSSPNYIFCSPDELFNFVNNIDLARINVQLDLFHAQLNGGNLTNTLRNNKSRIKHIQIADAPDRHQPGTGEINYRYIFSQLEEMGYEGYVSLEYIPKGGEVDSLSWLPFECRGEKGAILEHLNI